MRTVLLALVMVAGVAGHVEARDRDGPRWFRRFRLPKRDAPLPTAPPPTASEPAAERPLQVAADAYTVGPRNRFRNVRLEGFTVRGELDVADVPGAFTAKLRFEVDGDPFTIPVNPQPDLVTSSPRFEWPVPERFHDNQLHTITVYGEVSTAQSTGGTFHEGIRERIAFSAPPAEVRLPIGGWITRQEIEERVAASSGTIVSLERSGDGGRWLLVAQFRTASIAAAFEWDPLESTCRHASLSIL